MKILCSYCVIAAFAMSAACTVSPKSRTPEKSNEVDKEKVEAAETDIRTLHRSLEMIARITSPADNRLRDELGTDGNSDSSSFALVEEEKDVVTRKYSNVFALSAEVFGSIGFGRLEADSGKERFSVSFESLNAGKLSDGKVRVFLNYTGNIPTGNVSVVTDNSIYIKFQAEGESKKYRVYNRKTLDSDGGYSAQIDFDELDRFFQDFSQHTAIKQKYGVSGSLTVIKESNKLTIEGRNIGWFTNSHRVVASNVLASQVLSSQKFLEAKLDGLATKVSDGSEVGRLRIELDNSNKDSRSIMIYFGDSEAGVELEL